MHWLVKKVKIVDPLSPFHQQIVDVEIKADRIERIAKSLTAPEATVLSFGEQTSMSKGWIDLGAELGEPGFEHREDVESFIKAATQGGFTRVAVWPNTHPVIHDKSGVSFLKQKCVGQLVEILPIGAISLNCEGLEIAEMLDMRRAGAIAFSDGSKPVQHTGMIKRALLYAKGFDGTIINRPLDEQLSGKGQIHEGIISTTLGMPGIPALSEILMVERDMQLAAYTDSRIHLSCVSTAAAVEKIRQAKKDGVKITASVASLNLLFTDQDCTDFNTNYKLMPPLRSESDRMALILGLQDGTIDCISSNHVPRDGEAKHLEFPYADFGAINIATSFAVAATALGNNLDEVELIDRFTEGPAHVLQLPEQSIKEGEIANLSLYQLNKEWQPDKIQNASKSSNSPLWGKKVMGKPIGVFSNGKFSESN